MTKLSRSVLTEAESNLELAKRIWRDLSGSNADHSGVSIEIIGPYLLVSDTQDVWLTTTEEYQGALDSIVKSAAGGEYTDENEDDNDGHPPPSSNTPRESKFKILVEDLNECEEGSSRQGKSGSCASTTSPVRRSSVSSSLMKGLDGSMTQGLFLKKARVEKSSE